VIREELELLPCLYAFCDDLELEAVREVDHSSDDRCRSGRRVDPANERRIDLDGVDRHVGEVGERAVPGSEVVDGAPNPHRAKLLEALGRVLHVLYEDALCHFELKVPRVQTCPVEYVGDQTHDRLADELARRDVDRH
jgi:hypothetical protein